MKHEMRRKKQTLDQQDIEAVLKRGTSGVLAVCGENGLPYAVPLSYAHHDGKLIFHSAQKGHKIDLIHENNNVSFCVIDQDLIVPEGVTTYFRSVIVFGKARIIEDVEEKRKYLEILGAKYSPDHKEQVLKEIKASLNPACVIILDIEEMSGKEAKELVKEKKGDGLQ